MEGFVLFRKDRSEVKDGRGGGVILYVSEELTCTAADKLNSIKCEAVWVELQDKLVAVSQWAYVIEVQLPVSRSYKKCLVLLQRQVREDV